MYASFDAIEAHWSSPDSQEPVRTPESHCFFIRISLTHEEMRIANRIQERFMRRRGPSPLSLVASKTDYYSPSVRTEYRYDVLAD